MRDFVILYKRYNDVYIYYKLRSLDALKERTYRTNISEIIN